MANESTVAESQLNSFQVLALNAEQDRSAHFLVPQSHPEAGSSCIGVVHSSPGLSERPPFLFSHLEHSPSTYDDSRATDTNSNTCSNCGQWSEATSLHCDIEGQSVCPSCGDRLRVSASNCNTDDEIIMSFNSLSVSPAASESTTILRTVPVPPTTGSHMSCRQQAAVYRPSYFDDTTVDDLAGYLDEIMFLPKPMSEMAELMYT